MNEYGKGGYEFLTVSVTCLILASILLAITIKGTEKEKFQVFKYNAKTVGVNAVDYKYASSNGNGIVYLYQLVNDGFVSKIKNNFFGDSYCDMYESKVEFNNSGRLITLQCGSYLIYKQDISKNNYPIYRVGEWTYDKISGDDVESKKVYVIKDRQSDEYLLNGMYEKDLLLLLISDIYGSKYKDFNTIKEKFNVVEKKVYRTKILVDGVEN